MRRRATAAAGFVLLAIGLGACVATFLDERERVEDALGRAEAGWLLVAVALAVAAMASIAAGWRRCLAALGEPRPLRAVGRWYFLGELGKYVPGAIWPVVGRGELARRGGVPRGVAYHSVALSLAAWYGATALPVSVLAAHPASQRRARALVLRVSGGRWQLDVLPWRTLARLLVSYVPCWVLIAAATASTVAAYGGDAGWRAPLVAVAAWVLGFLAVPVPAGAGVREAAFVAASGLPAGLALTVAVTTRLAFVAADLAGAAVAAVGAGGRSRQPSAHAQGTEHVGVVVGPDRP